VALDDSAGAENRSHLIAHTGVSGIDGGDAADDGFRLVQGRDRFQLLAIPAEGPAPVWQVVTAKPSKIECWRALGFPAGQIGDGAAKMQKRCFWRFGTMQPCEIQPRHHETTLTLLFRSQPDEHPPLPFRISPRSVVGSKYPLPAALLSNPSTEDTHC
jgi:hypothetical protein